MKTTLPLFLISCILTALSTSSIFMFILILELMTITFISTLILETKTLLSSMKYFMSQSWASIFVLASFFSMNFSELFLMSGVLVKLGAAPLHFWFPSLAGEISWESNFILSTLMKMLPLYLMAMNFSHFDKMTLGLLSSIVGVWGGISVYCYRKMLAYSSINHLGWLMLSSVSIRLLIFYWFCYFIILWNLIRRLNSASMMYHSENQTDFNVMIGLFSLSGLPPFLGFIPKWAVISVLMSENAAVLTSALTFSVVGVFFYTRTMVKSFFFITTSELSLNLLAQSFLGCLVLWSFNTI